MKRVGDGVRKGSEWWCKAIRLAVAERRHALVVWLQRKDEMLYERYKKKRNQAKRAVDVAKVHADERWGRKMTENFHENKMIWKKVQRTRKETSGNEEKVKRDNGTMLVEKKAVKERWVEYFDGLLNVEEDREADIIVVGKENGVKC